MEEKLISRLQKEIPGQGRTLYRHLSDLVKNAEDPNALDALESLSTELKYESVPPSYGADLKQRMPECPIIEKERQNRFDTYLALSASKSEIAEDFVQTSAALRLCGLGFSSSESYTISLRVNELSKRPGVISCRFWGKALGTEKDYYIYEASIEGTGLPSDEVEPRGTGVNRCTYWVQNDPLEPMIQLCDASIESIRSARLVNKYLSGNLDRRVDSCPFFRGLESDLLRAQIARITADCSIHLTGYYTLDEESGDISRNEEFSYPSSTELGSQASFCHTADRLLPSGKTSYPNVEELDEEAAAVIQAEMTANPVVPRLTSIQTDGEPDENGNSSQWSIKQYGDKSTYSFNDAVKQYTVTVASSNQWQGWSCVTQNKLVSNFYCGYMVRSGDQVLTPWVGCGGKLCLPPIMGEPDFPVEESEPNPAEDPVEVVVVEEA